MGSLSPSAVISAFGVSINVKNPSKELALRLFKKILKLGI
jgi:hypothetical protein